MGAAYHQNVLDIRTDVMVTLARKRISVTQLMQLVPGAMIQFDKPCDEPLVLEVLEVPVAHGDAVKVGDKFGLRIRHLHNPHAREASELM
jgi:flagellar motor switch protein FliN